MAFAIPLHGMSRCIIVVAALVPLLPLALAATPAVLVLPFLRDGGSRASALIITLASWVDTVLVRSAAPHRDGRPDADT